MRAFIAATAVLMMLLGSAANAQCTSDDQCVPAACCHPDTCVYAPTAPFLNCTDVMCTLMCMPGTMDCGQGRCACSASGQCYAQIDSQWTLPPNVSIPEPPTSIGDCDAEEDCVPSQCCGPSSCVKKSLAPNCTDILCPAVCLPGTLDCGQGYCVCEEGTCQARFVDNSTTNPAVTPDPQSTQTDPTLVTDPSTPNTTRAAPNGAPVAVHHTAAGLLIASGFAWAALALLA